MCATVQHRHPGIVLLRLHLQVPPILASTSISQPWPTQMRRTVGEPYGGGPGVQGRLARRGHREMLQGPGQFLAAPADKGGATL